MTFSFKCIVLAALWLLYGFMVWFVCSQADGRTAFYFFSVLASILYMSLISVLLFVKGKP